MTHASWWRLPDYRPRKPCMISGTVGTVCRVCRPSKCVSADNRIGTAVSIFTTVCWLKCFMTMQQRRTTIIIIVYSYASVSWSQCVIRPSCKIQITTIAFNGQMQSVFMLRCIVWIEIHSVKKPATLFLHNFAKRWPILFSKFYSARNLQQNLVTTKPCTKSRSLFDLCINILNRIVGYWH